MTEKEEEIDKTKCMYKKKTSTALMDRMFDSIGPMCLLTCQLAKEKSEERKGKNKGKESSRDTLGKGSASLRSISDNSMHIDSQWEHELMNFKYVRRE